MGFGACGVKPVEDGMLEGPTRLGDRFDPSRIFSAAKLMANIENSVCDTSRQAVKQYTLRAAIQEANDTAGADKIDFNISGTASVKTISPTSPLPAITDPVTVDACTQPGASPNTQTEGNDAVLRIKLSGANAGRRARGLQIRAADSTIKGLVVSRFGMDGIRVAGTGATGNSIEGNFIGTDASGTQDLGNDGNAVSVGSANNTIGGTVSGAGNLISGNVSFGVFIAAYGTEVNGNTITDNGYIGVQIRYGDGNTVGGTGSDAGNQISNNGGHGVSLWFDSGTGNRILSNQIYGNDRLGIDLDNFDGISCCVTANDIDDPDTGANNLQNFPVISSATRDSTTGTTTITGTLNSNPSQTYTIQCFVTEAGGDPSGHGEGQTFLAETTTATDANGDATFTCTSDAPAVGNMVSVTATNTSGTAPGTAIGDTSEFSQNVTITSST